MDTSQDGLDAVLYQKQSDVMRVICICLENVDPGQKVLSSSLRQARASRVEVGSHRPVPRLLVLRIYRIHGQQPPYLCLDHS